MECTLKISFTVLVWINILWLVAYSIDQIGLVCWSACANFKCGYTLTTYCFQIVWDH